MAKPYARPVLSRDIGQTFGGDRRLYVAGADEDSESIVVSGATVLLFDRSSRHTLATSSRSPPRESA
jgi:hypothetical protein